MDLKKRPRGPNGISHVLPNGLHYLWEDQEGGHVVLAQDEDPMVPHGRPGCMERFLNKDAAYEAVDRLRSLKPLQVQLTDPLLPVLREVAAALACRDGRLGRAFYFAFHGHDWDHAAVQNELEEADERLAQAIEALKEALVPDHDKTGGEE